MPTQHSTPQTVLMIGPPLDQVGGIVAVAGQMRSLDFVDRHRLTFFPETHSREANEGFPRRVLRHVRHLALLRRTLRRTRATIIHIHTCSGFSFYRSTLDLLLGRLLGRRVVLHIHGAMFDEFHRTEPAWRRRVIAWSLARADRVIALSSRWRDKLLSIAPHAAVAVVENAVEIPDRPRPPRELPSAGCRFLLLARMDVWKGIDDLLAACERLHAGGVPFDLTLAGPPGTAGDAETINGKIASRQLQDAVRYVGSVEGERKAACFREADVYVQPSHYEGMPIALLEALAHGLPVVATRVGAVPEVLQHERQGLLVPAQARDQLSAAMRRVALDPALRQAMAGRAAALAARRFSLTRLRNDLLAIYDELSMPRRGTADTAVAHSGAFYPSSE